MLCKTQEQLRHLVTVGLYYIQTVKPRQCQHTKQLFTIDKNTIYSLCQQLPKKDALLPPSLYIPQVFAAIDQHTKDCITKQSYMCSLDLKSLR